MAIRNENMGIKIQVRFKKKPTLILEQSVRSKHNAYRHKRMKRFLAKSICMMKRRKVKVLTLGSNDCKRPFLDAYSSAKIDPFKKDRAPLIERSMKLWLLNTPIYPS
jgi:hypothetical protein